MNEHIQIEFSATGVSASEAGDYAQILFAGSNNDGAESLVMQTQCEFPQSYDFKFETKSGEVADVSRSSATLSRNRCTVRGHEGDLSIRLDIEFEATDDTFIELRRIMKMMVRKLDAHS